MAAQFITVFIALICCLNAATSENDESPKYKMVFDKLTKQQEATNILETNLKFEEGSSTLKISGEIKQLVDFDDTWKLSVSILRANAADAEYAPLLALAPKGVCEMLKTQYRLYFYDSLKENVLNAPEPTECPIAQRNYLLQDYELDTSKFKRFLRPGYYRAFFILTNNDDKVLEYVFDIHVEADV